MDLSPNDIRNYEFPNQMRGYDKEEVDNFLEQVAGALEAAKQEQLKLSMELDSVKSQLSGVKQFEETIKNAAIDARRNADNTVATAKKEAEEMLDKAKSEAAQALASRTQQVSNIEEQITQVGLTKKSYLSKVRSLIQSHLDLIDEIDRGEDAGDRSEDEIEVTESSEVKSKQRETVATQPSEQGPIKAEEANAPESSLEDLSEASKEDLSEALKDVLGDDDQAEDSAPIDPELAAALENYKKSAEEKAQAEASAPAEPEIPPPGVMQETTALAEDIPVGFVSGAGEQINTDTDKVKVTAPVAEVSEEPNSVNLDTPLDEEPKAAEPGALAKNLDEVVAKFEEEMDRAEQR
ncbi:MAG: DivIVA domain-containing protein [bacterium]|nr:DivIVA domain-containing protein [bacterium]